MNHIFFNRSFDKVVFLKKFLQSQTQPLRASLFNFKRPVMLTVPSILSITKSRIVSKKRYFSSYLRKLSLKDFLNSAPAHYTRLERFQQYSSPQRYNKNSLSRITFWGISYMTAVFFLTPFIFEIKPFSYFKTHPHHLIYGIIAANVGVCCLWQIPKYLISLQRYALLQKDFVYSKWSLIGSTFSHQEFWHLGFNMMCLWSFGTSIAMLLGPANFTNLYLNSAMAGSLFSLWFPKIARIVNMNPSLGASGAIFGLFGAFSYLLPAAKVMVFFLPVPFGAWYTFLGFAGWNVLGCIFRWGTFDYAAHVAGSLVGVTYGWWMSKKLKKRRQVRKLITYPRF